MITCNDVLAAIPDDHSAQVTPQDFFREIVHSEAKGKVVDLGCGNGRMADFFAAEYAQLEYVGLDISTSPEAQSRTRDDYIFTTYDGIHIPFESESIEIIFMNQILEHVRQPWLLFPEIERVLTRGGILVGSVSQLEPYHSFSLYNYTYYGICDFCDQFGLRVFRLRPGIDGMQIIARSFNKFILKRNYSWENMYFAHESPWNYALETFLAGRRPREINRAKLHTAGQFCFAARKPD